MNKSRPADFLGIGFFVHPLPLAMVALLALNDHYLKNQYPSWLTGKISDFAGLFFFPLFVCALVCVFVNFTFRRGQVPLTLNKALLLATVLATSLIFVAVKQWPAANLFYVEAMASMGFPSRLLMDGTDLVALVALSGTYIYGRRYFPTQ
jgi:hypothetical protein